MGLSMSHTLYDPLEPVEPWPWSGGAGFAFDELGPELEGAAGGGDAGFGGIWLAGAAGGMGRGAIGGAPTCVGEGDVCPTGGGAAETGRGGGGGGAAGLTGGGGGTAGLTGGGGAAAAGLGGDGGAGRGAGAGAAAIGFVSTTRYGAGVAAAGCLGAVF